MPSRFSRRLERKRRRWIRKRKWSRRPWSKLRKNFLRRRKKRPVFTLRSRPPWPLARTSRVASTSWLKTFSANRSFFTNLSIKFSWWSAMCPSPEAKSTMRRRRNSYAGRKRSRPSSLKNRRSVLSSKNRSNNSTPILINQKVKTRLLSSRGTNSSTQTTNSSSKMRWPAWVSIMQNFTGGPHSGRI